MSKVIRTARISGSIVTLGDAERELHLKEEQQEPDESVVDLARLLDARVEEVCKQLDQEWEERLRREKEELQAAADQHLQEAQAQWQAEREQLHQQRYEEGHQAGMDAREAEAREAVERLDRLHQAFKQERTQVLKEAELLVVDLATTLAHRVTGIQAEIDHKVLVRVIQTALEHLNERSNLEIKVHPDDLQIARRFAQRWVEKVAQDAVLKVTSSDHVSRGGCMVEGREENIDARLDEQFQVLNRALRAALFGEDETSESGDGEDSEERGEEGSSDE